MQTSEKHKQNNWPQALKQLLQNRHLPGLQSIMRHGQRLIVANEQLQHHLPSELRRHCMVMQVTPTELTIAVDSAAWMTRLRYLQPTLLQQLRQHPQLIHLSKLQLRISPLQTAPQLPLPAKPQHLSPENRQLLNQLATSVIDKQLQQALQKLAQK